MKIPTRILGLIVVVLFLSSTAHALTITPTGNTFDSTADTFTIEGENVNIGYVDIMIASADVQDNDDEETFLQTVLGTNYTVFTKDENMGDEDITPYPWVESDTDSSVIAYDFTTYFGFIPDFYLLKLGKGVVSGADSSFIFENVSNLNFAVVDLDAFGDSVDMYAISHVTAPVPEPSTLLLLGGGLVGLAFYRRKRK